MSTTVQRSASSRSTGSSQAQKAQTADELRAMIAQWAIKQAEDPNVGYSQGLRLGGASNGRRYFDCSGLCDSAYNAFGIHLGAMNTVAMRSSWPQWADQVPKKVSAMKPGDLILMDGHVVMYTGNGRCVSASSNYDPNGNYSALTNIDFANQVKSNVDVNTYLNRSDAIVLRPHVSPAQLANAPAAPSLQPPSGPIVGGGSSGGGGGYTGTSSYGSSGSYSPVGASSANPLSSTEFMYFLMQLLALLNSGDPGSMQAAQQLLASQFPGMAPAQLAQLAALLQASPELRKKVQQDPKLLEQLAKSPAEVQRLLDAAKPASGTGDAFAASRVAPVSMPSQAAPLQLDPNAVDPSLVRDVRSSMRGTIAA